MLVAHVPRISLFVDDYDERRLSIFYIATSLGIVETDLFRQNYEQNA